MNNWNTLIYSGVAIVLLLSATIFAAPMSLTNSFKVLPRAAAEPTEVNFAITDDPGSWFRSEAGPVGATNSLAIATDNPDGVIVNFEMSESNTVHTVTSLLWPTDAANMPFDQPEAFHGETDVTLEDPGLYVFVCKLHPFMLGAVIIDDPVTPGLDLGETVDMVNGIEDLPTTSDLAIRLVRAFYIITSPTQWQDFATGEWDVEFPAAPVRLTGGLVVSLDALNISQDLPPLINPSTDGVGEVWVATQYEKTEGKTKPGTMTVVNAQDWTVDMKVALPEINLNNPHNMWTDKHQKLIYTTQWFDNYLTTVKRSDGKLVANIEVGPAPAHVMTRVDTDAVHVGLNGGGDVVEVKEGGKKIIRSIDVSGDDLPAQPHAHWMGSDGKTMVTPNSNTGDSTYYMFPVEEIFAKPATGVLPIASSIMPDSSKYYVSNFLSNTISVIDMETGEKIKDINLLADYDPISGALSDGDGNEVIALGALPIQTPVSPNGKYMVTANTLTATIIIVDTDDDEIEKMLPCDAGCHGAQFGAKSGGGYYAYVTSKFANTLIVVDIDPNNDGEADDAAIVGRILLDATSETETDDDITLYSGMGGQGVLAIPVVYNGWVQNLPHGWKVQLTEEQQDPIG